MIVWVDGWQLQCCGQPFTVGSRVAWTLCPTGTDYVDHMLGADAGRAIDAAEEHHGGVPEGTPETNGIVTAIAAVHCRYAHVRDGDMLLYPVASSGVRTTVNVANGWAPNRLALKFAGYLVHLTV
jgi:hypothetical protein